MGIKVFAGSENDVLDRVSKTVKKFNVDIHVVFWRFTIG